MFRFARLTPLYLLLLLAIPACRLQPLEPLTEEGLRIIQQGDELDYYDHLKDKAKVSSADAARLFALLLQFSPWELSLQELKEELVKRHVVREDWEISEQAPLTKGKLAFMVCYSADIRTSMIMQLSVPSERYSLREAIFHDIMEPSSPHKLVSGQEALDVLSRTNLYLQKEAEKTRIE